MLHNLKSCACWQSEHTGKTLHPQICCIAMSAWRHTGQYCRQLFFTAWHHQDPSRCGGSPPPDSFGAAVLRQLALWLLACLQHDCPDTGYRCIGVSRGKCGKHSVQRQRYHVANTASCQSVIQFWPAMLNYLLVSDDASLHDHIDNHIAPMLVNHV